MIIRAADLESDMPTLIKGAREFAERASPWVTLPADDAIIAGVMTRLDSLEGVEILVAEHDGRVVGGIAMIYAPYLWNPSRIVAEELFWFAFEDAPKSTGRRLLDDVMMTIRMRKAIPMLKALVTSPPSVERIYRRYGLSPVETAFTRMH